MAASQRGDRNAYHALLTLLLPLLHRFFRRYVHGSALDDLVQDTLISVHRKRDSWDPLRPFLPWLFAIARYRWVDHLRRHYRAGMEEQLVDNFSIDSGESAIMFRLGCDHLLSMLPEGQAQAIRVTRIEGLSTAEASARLGQSESLLKVNVHRGLKKLASLIEDER
ncbi:RNA polymerase sigma-70 factor (ECF subfamily) [Polymorphobacter multimanifer]|uniref:RNA polymerase sigma-70 factor (ECF subfamily) n=2 Tax=Polymorphobacter multimanifer TaxID=1070431 RepID=A0A841L8V4_9SPHN|nr:RNA polymerase sigma-70 factor (ECF subfamily) [Polymorphobacter multimanifer]